MTTTTLGHVNYDRPSKTSGLAALLRSVFDGAGIREENFGLSDAAHLGPEQLKEMGAYSDLQTGLVYSNRFSR